MDAENEAVVMERRKQQRHPEWIRSIKPSGHEYSFIEKELKKKNLHTVCTEARCPNIGECWAAKTATIMILGDTCTRACKFCHVKTGNPHGLLDPNEPAKSAEMVKLMSLRYVVITSVDRDDLPDFGAGHFSSVITKIQEENPTTKIEVLIPDFNDVPEHMDTLAKSNPFVIAQNLETVDRLTKKVRDRRAGYEKTLNVLKYYKEHFPHIVTKSSLMVGLGETKQELITAFRDLRKVGVDILTLGQYLMPSKRHLSVERFYHPDEFKELKEIALNEGFQFVASGPFVRSSYKAGDFLDYLKSKGIDV